MCPSESSKKTQNDILFLNTDSVDDFEPVAELCSELGLKVVVTSKFTKHISDYDWFVSKLAIMDAGCIVDYTIPDDFLYSTTRFSMECISFEIQDWIERYITKYYDTIVRSVAVLDHRSLGAVSLYHKKHVEEFNHDRLRNIITTQRKGLQ